MKSTRFRSEITYYCRFLTGFLSGFWIRSRFAIKEIRGLVRRKCAGNEETRPLWRVAAAAGGGAHDTKGHGIAGLQLRLDLDHVLDRGDRLAVDGHYHVLLKQADVLGKRSGVDAANDQAAFAFD